jgi:hypothetical protein
MDELRATEGDGFPIRAAELGTIEAVRSMRSTIDFTVVYAMVWLYLMGGYWVGEC